MSSPPLMSVLGGSSSSDFTSTSSSTSSPTTHHSSSYSNLSPSILIIILILSITIIASVFLCYLLRHLNRRCLRHLSPSSTAVSANESNHFSSRRISPETPNPAFTIVDSLPLFAFSAITRRSTSAASVVAGDCAVCLSKFEPDDQLRLLPLCCHAFHSLCVDTWLRSNQTCPLCRSPLIASEAELLKASGGDQIGNSFRLEIGNISQRQTTSDYSGETRRSYSIGSFDYLVDEDSEVFLNKEDNRPPPATVLPAAAPEPTLVAEVASGRSWLKDYVDRLSMSLSSRAHSFRSSGRFFSGSSRRSEVPAGVIGDWDLEASRVGEEISEMFRWASGV